MDVVATNETVANTDINPSNSTNFPSLDVCRRFNKEGLLIDDSDDSSLVRITPHYESITAGDESFVSPIYTPEIMKSAPWEVSVAFFPNYLPRINPDLEGLLHVDNGKDRGNNRICSVSLTCELREIWINNGMRSP